MLRSFAAFLQGVSGQHAQLVSLPAMANSDSDSHHSRGTMLASSRSGSSYTSDTPFSTPSMPTDGTWLEAADLEQERWVSAEDAGANCSTTASGMPEALQCLTGEPVFLHTWAACSIIWTIWSGLMFGNQQTWTLTTTVLVVSGQL